MSTGFLPLRPEGRRAAISARSLLLTLAAFLCGVGLLNLAQYFWLRAMRDAIERSQDCFVAEFSAEPAFESNFEGTIDMSSLYYKSDD